MVRKRLKFICPLAQLLGVTWGLAPLPPSFLENVSPQRCDYGSSLGGRGGAGLLCIPPRQIFIAFAFWFKIVWLGWFHNLTMKDSLEFIFVPVSTCSHPLSGLQLLRWWQGLGESPSSSMSKLSAALQGACALLFPPPGVSLSAAIESSRTSEVPWIHNYLVALH